MRDEIRFSGLSSLLSDYECKDGEAAVMDGCWQGDGGVRRLALPDAVAKLGAGLQFVDLHETSSFRRWLILVRNTLTDAVCWIDEESAVALSGTITAADLIRTGLDDRGTVGTYDVGTVKSVSTIGNTVMVVCQDGIHYALWTIVEGEQAYKDLGTHLPELPLSFSLDGEVVEGDAWELHVDLEDDWSVPEDDVASVTTAVRGHINKFIADESVGKGKFMFPFLVRYAYRLYDDTYTMHSAPVLMTACSYPMPALVNKNGDKPNYDFKLAAIVSELEYCCVSSSALAALKDWGDIVRGVDIFVTPPIYTYDQNGAVETMAIDEDFYCYSVCKLTGLGQSGQYGRQWFNSVYSGWTANSKFVKIPGRSADSVKEDVGNASSFYLLKSLDLDDILTTRTAIDVPDEYLQSLLQRRQLQDDYNSHDKVIAEDCFVYNSRVNLSGLKVQRFVGQHPLSLVEWDEVHYTNETNYMYYHLVDGETKLTTCSYTGHCWVSNDMGMRGLYLYYPAMDCEKATIEFGSSTRKVIKMRRHDFLNGALYWEGFVPLVQDSYAGSYPRDGSVVEKDANDKIYTSEVNNPFSFPVEGINSIPGGGAVIGLSSTTKALSEGQFGAFPLYAFTTNGIWALEVSDTGTYKARQPVSRDVCLSRESITQTDGAVLFVSERGIMLLSGSKVECVSDNIRLLDIPVGDDTVAFLDWVDGSRIAYDYVNQRLLCYNPAYDYALVFSLESKQWGGGSLGISYHLAAWPASYVMTEDGSVVRLGALDVSGGDTVSGEYVTRPLKLQQGDVLKTVRAVMARGKFRAGHVRMRLYGSRDLFGWNVVWASHSHRLRGFSGTPYKYFKLHLDLTLQADESVSGLTIEYQPKYLRKLR